jgi:hypothetical protein
MNSDFITCNLQHLSYSFIATIRLFIKHVKSFFYIKPVLYKMRWILSNLPNPSGLIMTLGSTQHLTKMSTSDLPAGQRTAGS